jgi:DNA-binding transcriptional regulator YhcF (GntR family)
MVVEHGRVAIANPERRRTMIKATMATAMDEAKRLGIPQSERAAFIRAYCAEHRKPPTELLREIEQSMREGLR